MTRALCACSASEGGGRSLKRGSSGAGDIDVLDWQVEKSVAGARVQGKVVLVTGGAKRVGAAICRRLHAAGANLMLHYRASAGEARLLQAAAAV